MAEVNQQPPTKRSKLTGDKELARLWQHYQNYIDGGGSDEEEDGGGDVDELYEIISILSSRTITPLSNDFTNDGDAVVLLSNIQHLLSILLSMTYLHLANYSITTDMEQDTDNDTSSPEYYFEKSLHYWPSNPAALSLLANYHRMNNLSSIKDICTLYIKASESAKYWRDNSIKFLQSSIDEKEDMLEGINIKEMVEVLIVNGALEIDYIGKEEDEEDEEGDTNEVEKDTPDEYSCSEVECTASFMSAFLLSTLNQHDDALVYLKKFQNLSHRIHPNVWIAASGTLLHDQNEIQATISSPATTSILFEPRIYRGDDTNGLLPTNLYQSLCSLFAPDAPYWYESDYQNRGYYSYFTPIDKEKEPNNVIEDVIKNHLLPIAEQQCSESIVGVEWWVHTRPTESCLGHPLHFDTDEALLGREKKVSHPVVSSVLYLTGAERDKETNSASAGPTIVFDQTPDSTTVASKAWISKPKDNSFLVFPGNLLHGVLPCSGGCSDAKQTNKENENHRLTLMVGFWTRDVTVGMNDRSLYSACGPLPPPNSEHSWVLQSQNRYLEKTMRGEKTDTNSEPSKFDVLKCVSPAWEQFEEDDSATLVIPGGLDHRYFVCNAPRCFSDDLFEK